jgi:hypothetical protein
MGRRPAGGVAALRYRRALVRTAVSAAVAGWPIVPGAWWSGADRRFVCDLAGCGRTGPHPAVQGPGVGLPPIWARDSSPDQLATEALRHPEAVAARWRRRPYSVLVPTGETCDVVDVTAETGRMLAMRLDARSNLGPVIAAGARWLLLTAPGGDHAPVAPGTGGAAGAEQVHEADVIVHGRGSWIMLPPSVGPGGEPATWLARPRGSGWALPRRDDVLTLLAALRPPVTV